MSGQCEAITKAIKERDEAKAMVELLYRKRNDLQDKLDISAG